MLKKLYFLLIERRMMQYEYKKENRKDRYKAKRDIQEGIQEYESRDNLSCSSCIFYDKGFCEKGLLMTAQNIGIKVWTSILMEV